MDLTRIWIFLTTTLCAGSWILSYFHALNATGYFSLFALQFSALFVWIYRESSNGSVAGKTFAKIARRWRKPLPFAFLLMCLINFVGGAFNDVANGDSQEYRIPRMLHWLAEGGWHWIHSADERMNVVCANYEWLGSPILLFLKDERWIFLVSLSAFMLLPGIFFVFLRLVGVRGKVAWWWMWILPAGYVYAMQAGSVATDGFTATVALAAVAFALRGAALHRPADMLVSILAFGLLTGIKQVTLPLTIIWIVPMFVGVRLLWKQPLGMAICTIICLLASAMPITIANLHYTGSWKGFQTNYEQASAFWGLIGNAIVVPIQNLQPPFFPWADQWNGAMRRFVQTPFGSHFNSFEAFIALSRAPNETMSGLGLGPMILVVASIVALFRQSPSSRVATGAPNYIRMVRWFPLIAAGAFMAKSALMQNARYLGPFYPFLLPLLLARRGWSDLIRKRWWRITACAVVTLTIVLLAVSRERPIWPAEWVTARLRSLFPESHFVGKVRNAYSFYWQGHDALEKVRAVIPASEKRIGYSAVVGKNERALWHGSAERKVYRINPTDEAAYARSLGVTYVLVEPSAVSTAPGKSIQGWLDRFGGKVVGEFGVRGLPDSPPNTCYIVRLKP